VVGPLCYLKAEAAMIKVGTLLQSPEAPHSASTVAGQLRDIDEKAPQLLELRTEAGAVYLCPSPWQRIRLQWTFRHFRVLSPQVLSRSDQRLIEKLSHSAVVTPPLPVASSSVFGVVEKAPSKAPAAANRAEVPAFLKPGGSVDATPAETWERAGGIKAWTVLDPRLRHWRVLGALAAACVAVTVASIYGVLPFSRNVQGSKARTPSTSTHAAADPKPLRIHAATTSPLPAAPATASSLNAEKPKRWVAPPPPEPTLANQDPAPPASGSAESLSGGIVTRSLVPATVPDAIPEPAAIVDPAHAERRFVAELPPGHFAHPVVTERDPVGELRLKALIGADGSVKEVTVISGNPKLAEIGMRAVRQWHYSPYQVLGRPVEVETQIKMSFFGQDAISIASVADGSAPR
jgi:Gram-negative bacterial TonB protein C-terminal